MPTIADLSIKYSADTSGAEAGTGKVQSLISGLSTGAKGLATVAGGFLLANAVQNVVGGIGQLAGAGLNFEQQMANVNSVLQDDAAVKRYGDALIALSSDPRVLAGPTELAAGFYNVVSAGFAGQGALDVMTQAAYAATAGMTTADVAAGAIAGTMNAYGQETYTAQQVSDALFGAVNAGSLTFEQLAANLGNTTSLASQMGVGINELASAYAVMSNNNISAAQAETQISAVMRSAANPTQALTDAVTAHGYATAEAAIASEGFGGFIDMVTEAAGGSKEKLYDMLGTQEAVNAALILGADGGSDYAKVLAQIEAGTEGVGATQLALAKQTDSARFKMQEARKQVEIAATLLGGAFAPAIGKAAAAFSGFIQGATKFTQSFLQMMNPAANFSGWLKQFPGWAQPVIKAMAGIFQAGGDVVDALQDFKRGDFAGGFRELKEAASTAWDAISGLASTTLNWVLDTGVPAITGWVVDHAADVWSGIKTLAGWTWDNRAELGNITLAGTVSLGSEIISNLRSAIDTMIQSVRGFIEGHKSEIDSAISRLFDFNTTGLSGQALGERFGDWLNGLDWGGLFGSYASISAKFYDGVSKAILAGVTLLAGIAGQVGAFIGGFVVGMFERIEWGRLTSLIGDQFRQVFDGASQQVQQAVQQISDYLGRELSRAGQAVSTALGPAKTAIDNISTAAGNAVTLVKNLITEGFDKLQGVGANVQAALEPVITAITAISDAAKTAIGWLDKLTFWNNQNSGGDGSGRTPREQNEMTAPGSGYVTPNNTGEAVNLPGGGYITNLPNTGAGPGSGASAIAAQAKALATQTASAMSQFANAVRTGVAQATAALNPMGAAFTATGARVTAATTQMSAQVRAQVTAMVAQARAQFTAFQASTAATMTAIQAATTATVSALVAQVNAQFSQMTAQATAQANQMRGSVQSAMQGMAAAGQSAMQQFASAVQSGFSQAAAAAQSGVNAIRGAVNSLGSMYGQGFSVGSSLGEGVAAGLYSQVGAVAAAAAALVNAASAAAQARGQIASPSKLMRDEIGIPLAQGVMVGMESQRRDVANTFASLIPVDARNGRGYPSSGSGAGLASAARGGGVTNVYHVYQVTPEKLTTMMQEAKNGNAAYQAIGPRSREVSLGLSRGGG